MRLLKKHTLSWEHTLPSFGLPSKIKLQFAVWHQGHKCWKWCLSNREIVTTEFDCSLTLCHSQVVTSCKASQNEWGIQLIWLVTWVYMNTFLTKFSQTKVSIGKLLHFLVHHKTSLPDNSHFQPWVKLEEEWKAKEVGNKVNQLQQSFQKPIL